MHLNACVTTCQRMRGATLHCCTTYVTCFVTQVCLRLVGAPSMVELQCISRVEAAGMKISAKGWLTQRPDSSDTPELLFIESIYSARDVIYGHHRLWLVAFRFPLSKLDSKKQGNILRVSTAKLAALLNGGTRRHAEIMHSAHLRSEPPPRVALCNPGHCPQGMWPWQLVDFEEAASAAHFLPLHLGHTSEEELTFTFRL